MTKKHAVIFTLCFLALMVFLINQTSKPQSINSTNNVTLENDTQIITIQAKGGYIPTNTNAQANTATKLKINTQGTFDCSASLVIPDLGYKTFLPPSGESTIDIPPQKSGTKLTGLCSMGMYSFSINFN